MADTQDVKTGRRTASAPTAGSFARSLLTPLLCPHCGWQGTVEDDDIDVDYDRWPDGLRKGTGTMWPCPSCEMMVHPEDEGQ